MTYYEGVVVLLEADGKGIAMQLRDDIPFWGLFGGWVEAGESPEDAIVREVHEELSVLLPQEKFSLKAVHYLEQSDSLRQNAKCYVFHAALTDELDDAILREGLMWRFMKLEDLSHENIIPHQLMMIKNYYGL
jgi:8-oxo-dGTP diphosphatase